MKKGPGYKDRSLFSLAISLPSADSTQSIIDLNPFLANMKFLRRDTGKIELVFPDARQTRNHVLVEHAVRVGWFDSPHKSVLDIRKRCEDAATTGGYLSAKPKAQTGWEKISEKDLYFEQGSLARTYLLQFMQAQMHPGWEVLNKVLLVNDKLFQYVSGITLDKATDPNILKEFREYQKASLDIANETGKIHNAMLYMMYSKEDIDKFLGEDIRQSQEPAVGMAERLGTKDDEEFEIDE